MAVTQAFCAAGILVLGILTWTGRITKTLREEIDTKFNSVRDEMRADREVLRDEMRAGFSSTREEMRADREVIFGEIKSLRDEMRAGFSSTREEMRSDRAAIFGEIKSLREEMHDMNGRLGRVEGHMGISAANRLQESQ